MQELDAKGNVLWVRVDDPDGEVAVLRRMLHVLAAEQKTTAALDFLPWDSGDNCRFFEVPAFTDLLRLPFEQAAAGARQLAPHMAAYLRS